MFAVLLINREIKPVVMIVIQKKKLKKPQICIKKRSKRLTKIKFLLKLKSPQEYLELQAQDLWM